MKRGPWSVLVLLLVALLAVGNPALARKSSSFSSGGRSSTRSSGWSNSTSTPKSSGWSSTPAAPSQPSSPPPSSSGWGSGSRPAQPAPSTPAPGAWGNTSGASAPSGGSQARRSSSFATSGQAAIQKESSRKAYSDYTGRFAKPDNPVGPSGAPAGPAPTRTWDNYGDYRSYRDNYYSGRGWSAPGYAFRSFPSFGIWDAMFLWFMLRQASGPSFMYNHQNDPGVKAFREEADKLSADNADLKKQLSDLDAKVDQMRKDGLAPDPKAMPQGVDPAVALAAETVVKEKADSGGGMGKWLLIIGAGFGVAALFLLASSRRRRNIR
jgi:hypothetical protein